MRRATLLFSAVAMISVLVGGVVMAAIKCSGGECLGTNGQKDTLTGSSGRDVMYGRGGADLLKGQAGNDEMYGGPGGDQMFGGPGDDEMYGGSGKDTIGGQEGVERIYGGSGDDTIDSSGDAQIDVVDCGDGTDTVTISEVGGDDVTFECEKVIAEGVA